MVWRAWVAHRARWLRHLVCGALVIGLPGAFATRAECQPCADVAQSSGWWVGNNSGAYIRVVGTDPAGVPDPAGRFTVTIRDLANHPIPNAPVMIDFGACGEMTLCDAAAPGQIVHCASKTIRGYTDELGRITFAIVGSGNNTGAVPGQGSGCARIVANESCPLTYATVVLFDQNGGVTAPGMEVTDLTAWLKDFGTGIYFGRSDYDMSGGVGVGDLSAWLNFFGAAGSVSGCATSYCP